MRTIKINLFKFDELSDEAKKKVVEKLSAVNVEYDWWESTYEDAKNIGLKITGFDLDRNRYAHGAFIENARDVAEHIIANHGEQCETYKTAQSFLAAYDNLQTQEEDGLMEEEEETFLKAILEDYSIILQKESEYLQSDEAIIETIVANDYEFEEDGTIH